MEAMLSSAKDFVIDVGKPNRRRLHLCPRKIPSPRLPIRQYHDPLSLSTFLWLLALLPLLALLRGRRGPVATVKYSSADIAREVARETRSRARRWQMPLTLLALALLIVGLAGSNSAAAQAR